MKKALDTKCACRHRFIKGFYRELKKLGYYPGLELVTWKRPVLEVIHNLKENWKFDFRCESCGGVDINEIFNIGDYAFQGFQGLCLDCVGKPRLTNDVHDAMDYPLTCRNSDMESIIWDEGCACRHGASTWRFSFFAREWSENIQDEGAFDIFEDVVQT